MLKVLDLFSGLKGWSSAFHQRGHDCTTVEINPNQNPTICGDIMQMSASELRHPSGDRWDIILASPPCTTFSVASIGKHWESSGVPKTEEARRGMLLVCHTLGLIESLQPRYWVMENPRGMLRKLPFMQRYERRTVTFCKYGEKRMKPTDLWGNFPIGLELYPACKNGDKCHDSAPRGSRTGTQGIVGADKRAVIPFGLSLAVCMAMESCGDENTRIPTLPAPEIVVDVGYV